jgi:hypothetical protein
VAPSEFVETWQKADSLEDVVNTLSLKSITSARSRASNYRKKGIELKFFPGTRGAKPLNVDELNELAVKFAPKDGGGAKPAAKAKSSKRKSKAKSKKN